MDITLEDLKKCAVKMYFGVHSRDVSSQQVCVFQFLSASLVSSTNKGTYEVTLIPQKLGRLH